MLRGIPACTAVTPNLRRSPFGLACGPSIPARSMTSDTRRQAVAREIGLSHTTVRRIWNAFGLQPHRSETFKLSSDPLFVDKVRDIVGLYLSPPDRALVLCVDEKSQIQALDREQPVLPMMPGMPERRTHNYIRHGTTSLFAALGVAAGFVIGKCYKRHRAKEFLDVLEEIDGGVNAKLNETYFSSR